MMETTAVLRILDIVVSVDTTVVHLASAWMYRYVVVYAEPAGLTLVGQSGRQSLVPDQAFIPPESIGRLGRRVSAGRRLSS